MERETGLVWLNQRSVTQFVVMRSRTSKGMMGLLSHRSQVFDGTDGEDGASKESIHHSPNIEKGSGLASCAPSTHDQLGPQDILAYQFSTTVIFPFFNPARPFSERGDLISQVER